jgi:NAD(P)-dependent dehydrogenase (short-subunit alcohol dehydrogenase family)
VAVYVVTGATGTLGGAVARTLLLRGHHVAVPFRHRDRFLSFAASVDAPDRLLGESAEIDRMDDAERLMRAVVAWAGRLDGVAAIAGGYASSGKLEAAPASEWEEMLRVNLQTAYATCRAAVPHLVATCGSLVTCSSRAVVGGGAGTAYVTSKAAVEALTREIAHENRTRGVRANAIAPGTIDTPANRRDMPEADPASWTPAEEIAEVVAFLLSPESAPITGAIVPVHSRRSVSQPSPGTHS